MGKEQIQEIRLFSFHGKNGSIQIDIAKRIEFVPRTVPKLGTFRESFISNEVYFSFHGLALDNSFIALSSLESLITIFVRGRFGQHNRRAQIKFMHNEKMFGMIAEKISQGKGRLPLLKLGLDNSNCHIILNETYAFQLASSIRKAENWLTPAHSDL